MISLGSRLPIRLLLFSLWGVSISCNNDHSHLKHASVNIDISKKNIASSKGPISEVKGWPIQVIISMNNESQNKLVGYYVHILQIESGVGLKYYYQGSTGFFNKSKTILPVWLGRPGEIDLGKTFQIIAIINKDDPYKKDRDGIRVFTKLPSPAVSQITVKRIKKK